MEATLILDLKKNTNFSEIPFVKVDEINNTLFDQKYSVEIVINKHTSGIQIKCTGHLNNNINFDHVYEALDNADDAIDELDVFSHWYIQVKKRP